MSIVREIGCTFNIDGIQTTTWLIMNYKDIFYRKTFCLPIDFWSMTTLQHRTIETWIIFRSCFSNVVTISWYFTLLYSLYYVRWYSRETKLRRSLWSCTLERQTQIFGRAESNILKYSDIHIKNAIYFEQWKIHYYYLVTVDSRQSTVFEMSKKKLILHYWILYET